MSKKGIDISKWQGTIDWGKVKKAGVEFAMLREGYGKNDPTQVDSKFEENYEKAKAAGIPVGVYHYSYADSVSDAKLEAFFCLNNIKGKQLEYPVVFDIEDKEMLKLTNRQRTDICKAFCDQIEKAGYYAMIYCNLNWLNNYLIKDELLDKYDLWLAEWYKDKPSVECGIWQKSEKGKVDGISGNVDLNVAYKDYPAIMKSKGLNGFKKVGTAPKIVTYTVQKGDTLTTISDKFGVSIDSIAINNGIKDKNKIYVGQILKIK